MKKLLSTITLLSISISLTACKSTTEEKEVEPENIIDVEPISIASVKSLYTSSLKFYQDETSIEKIKLNNYIKVDEGVSLSIKSSTVDFAKVGRYTLTVEAKKNDIVQSLDLNVVIEDKLTEDEIFSKLDRATAKMITRFVDANGNSNRDIGSGYIIDFDEASNKLYFATNHHVVGLLNDIDNDYIAVVTETIPAFGDYALCGKVVHHANSVKDDAKTDFAIVEVSSISTESYGDLPNSATCKNVKDINLSRYKSFFDVLRFEELENSLIDYFKENKVYSVGYPLAQYSRMHLFYDDHRIKFDYNWRNIVSNSTTTFKFDTIEFTSPQDLESGASGSGIVNNNLRIVGSLFMKATERNLDGTSKAFGYAITNEELQKQITNFCNNGFAHLNIC